MMRDFLLTLSLLTPVPAFPLTLYIDASFGVTEQGPDLSGTLDHARTLGRFSAGIGWQGLYIELDHISDVQVRDRGINTIWLGMRKEFQLR